MKILQQKFNTELHKLKLEHYTVLNVSILKSTKVCNVSSVSYSMSLLRLLLRCSTASQKRRRTVRRSDFRIGNNSEGTWLHKLQVRDLKLTGWKSLIRYAQNIVLIWLDELNCHSAIACNPDTYPAFLHLTSNQQQPKFRTAHVVNSTTVASSWWWP